MAKSPKRTTTAFNNQLDKETVDAFRAFCDGRGEKIRYHLEIAMRRHIANPPPTIEIPPLPPMTVKKSKS